MFAYTKRLLILVILLLSMISLSGCAEDYQQSNYAHPSLNATNLHKRVDNLMRIKQGSIGSQSKEGAAASTESKYPQQQNIQSEVPAVDLFSLPPPVPDNQTAPPKEK